MSSLLLATYGTLMRTFEAQERLGIRQALSFQGACRIEGQLYDLGTVPGAVPGEQVVHGELFRLASDAVWTVLDEYEGYDPDREADSWYVRRRVPLQAPADCTAWVYWYNGDVSEKPMVPSGDWREYVEGDKDS